MSCLLSAPSCSFPSHEFTNDSSRFSGGAHSTTASAGTGGAGGTSSEGGVGGVTSTAGGVETCDNRIDDDLDGRIDCADADCQTSNWTCLAPIPVGWEGPIAMATATDASLLPPCDLSGGYRVPVSSVWCSKVSSTAAACPACPTCGAVENPIASVNLDLGSDCSGTCPMNAPSDCRVRLLDACQRIQVAQSMLAPGFNLSQLNARVELPNISGKCANPDTPMDGSVDGKCLEPMIICRGAATGTCPSTDSCVLKPQPPFKSSPCIYFKGAQPSCPEGWNALRQMAYANVVDTRGCTNCTCTPPDAESYVKDAAVTVSDYGADENCLPSAARASSGSGGCLPGLGSDAVSGVVTHYVKANFTVPQKACVSSGGKSIGSVETQEPMTICCTSL